MKMMKKMFAKILTVVIGSAGCLCGNAASAEATYREDGIMPLASSTHTVYYEDKTNDEYKMVLRHPEYTFTPYVSSCACVAGANVIGFYDRYDENLIPDHQAGIVFQGQYAYRSEDTPVYAVIRQLYADMGTDDSGTTVPEFKNGMTTFCNRKGKTITFTSCMKNGKFDYATAQSYMESNLPIVLFCSGFNVANFNTFEGRDVINYYESTGNHVMVGFGYQIINYTVSSSNETYEFIKVASGTNSKSNGYFDIHYNTNINDAYAVNIY